MRLARSAVGPEQHSALAPGTSAIRGRAEMADVRAKRRWWPEPDTRSGAEVGFPLDQRLDRRRGRHSLQCHHWSLLEL